MNGIKTTSEPQGRLPARHLAGLHAVVLLLIDMMGLAGGRLALNAERREGLAHLDITDLALELALDVSHGDGLLDVHGRGLDVELRLPGYEGGAA
jgi:hypothetical protein